MAYDTKLEERLDKIIESWGLAFAKKKMFGGIGYLLNGNMAFGVHKDELILRADEEQGKELLQKPGIREFDMGRGPAKNWFFAGAKAIEGEALAGLAETGRDYAASLPPK